MSEPLSIFDAATIAGRAIERLEPSFPMPSTDELMNESLGYGFVKGGGLLFDTEDFETIDRLLYCLKFGHRNLRRILMDSMPDLVGDKNHVIVGFQFAIKWDGPDFLETNVPTGLSLIGRMLVRKKSEDEE